jgi:hypothetical protein
VLRRDLGLPTKYLPAAHAARLEGGALLRLTLLSSGPPPLCSSQKLWQLQLAPTLASEGGSELSGQPLTLGGLSLLPDLKRDYESSVPDSLAADIWFTATTKKSHASD